jgi:hypothetical protein
MQWFIGIGLFFVTMVVFVLVLCLFSPFELRISTENKTYQLKWLWLGKAWFMPGENDIIGIQFWLFKWEKNLFEALNSITKSKEEKKKPKVPEKRKGKFPLSLKQIKGMIRTFEIKRFRLAIDTGNPILTAQFFSVVGAIPKLRRAVYLNFQGINYLDLWVRNRFIFIVLFLFKSKFL